MNDPLHRASVTLLVREDDLVPEQITALLGGQPELAVRKGQTFVHGSPKPRSARTGIWACGTGYREPPCIDEQIRELLDSLNPDLKVWADLTTRYDCYVTVGVYFDPDSWTGGIVLEAKTLSMLGERGLAIDFDMYAPGASK